MRKEFIVVVCAMIFAALASGCVSSKNEIQETSIKQTYEIKLIESYREYEKTNWIIHYVNNDNKIEKIEEGDLPYTGKYTKETIQINRVNDSRTYLVYEKDIEYGDSLTHVYTLHMGDDIRILGTENTYRSGKSTVETSTGQIYP